MRLDGDTLFVVGAELLAIKIQDGTVIWRVKDMTGLKRPVVFGDMILARDGHILYAFDKQRGVEIGRLPLELAPGGNNVELNPAVYDDLLLIPVGKTTLAAYRLKMP